MSSGRQSHPITWITLASYPATEAGFHAAIRYEATLIESDFAVRIIKTRDNDSRKVWMVQKCKPWGCCEHPNT